MVASAKTRKTEGPRSRYREQEGKVKGLRDVCIQVSNETHAAMRFL